MQKKILEDKCRIPITIKEYFAALKQEQEEFNSFKTYVKTRQWPSNIGKPIEIAAQYSPDKKRKKKRKTHESQYEPKDTISKKRKTNASHTTQKASTKKTKMAG